MSSFAIGFISLLIGACLGGVIGWCVGVYMGEAWAREEADPYMEPFN